MFGGRLNRCRRPPCPETHPSDSGHDTPSGAPRTLDSGLFCTLTKERLSERKGDLHAALDLQCMMIVGSHITDPTSNCLSFFFLIFFIVVASDMSIGASGDCAAFSSSRNSPYFGRKLVRLFGPFAISTRLNWTDDHATIKNGNFGRSQCF
ncbi:hypothetical protein LX36DRAFT_339831 [Colletotrichum falcatum]|nr:hypothetical protein LX36DRAFT_339831 [Colletotrichum falcatum]